MFSMSSRSRIIAASALVLLAGGPALAGGGTSIQGTLIDEDGKPFKGGEIRAQRVDIKAKAAIAGTKADGHYYFVGLPAGAYSITAYVDGVAMSRANVRTRTDGWVKVNFDLRLNAKGADGGDRMQQDIKFGDRSLHVDANNRNFDTR